MRHWFVLLITLLLSFNATAQEQWSVSKAWDDFEYEDYYPIFEERTADFIYRKCESKVKEVDALIQKFKTLADNGIEITSKLPKNYDVKNDRKLQDLSFEQRLAFDAMSHLPGPDFGQLVDLWNDSICDYDLSQGVTPDFKYNAARLCRYVDGQIFAYNIINKATTNMNTYLSSLLRKYASKQQSRKVKTRKRR